MHKKTHASILFLGCLSYILNFGLNGWPHAGLGQRPPMTLPDKWWPQRLQNAAFLEPEAVDVLLKATAKGFRSISGMLLTALVTVWEKDITGESLLLLSSLTGNNFKSRSTVSYSLLSHDCKALAMPSCLNCGNICTRTFKLLLFAIF